MHPVEAAFYELCHEVFGFDLAGYLNTSNRPLLGVQVNIDQRTYSPLFGEFPIDLLPTINTRFVDSVAGYKVGVKNTFPRLNEDSDLLLLSAELVAEPIEEIEPLLIHEICHLVVDANLYEECSLSPGQKDNYHGEKLHKKTDIENESITQHDIEFCKLLATASEKISTIREKYPDRWSVIKSAMRFDLIRNVRRS